MSSLITYSTKQKSSLEVLFKSLTSSRYISSSRFTIDGDLIAYNTNYHASSLNFPAGTSLAFKALIILKA
jgi:hypothetical protein